MNRWHAGRTLPQVLAHYAIAVVAGILALLARDAAAPVIGAGSPWLFLYPVSVILALYFGTGPALMASLAGSITAVAIFDLDRQHTMQGAVIMLTAGFTAWVVAGRRQLAQALRDSEDRFRSLFEAAPIGIAQISPNGRLITVNPALCGLLGYTAHELRTKSIRDLVHPEDLPSEAQTLRRMQDSATDRWIQEQRLLHRDGTPIWVSVASTVVRDAGGAILSRISVIADIREERRAAADLERAVRIRDEFLALASHELRTPLTSLLLQIGSLLRRGSRRPDQAPLPDWAVRKLRAGSRCCG